MEQKDKILKHIKATRIWLDKAEKWAENNNLIKAILNLFLASAEIQFPLRSFQSEKIRNYSTIKSKKNYFKYYYISSAIAASILIISLFAYFNFKNSPVNFARKDLEIEEKSTPNIPSSTAKEILKKKEPDIKISVKKESLESSEILKTAKIAKISSKISKKLPSKEYTFLSQKKEKEGNIPFDIELIEMVRIAEKTLREGAE
jgi:hypothetical protein